MKRREFNKSAVSAFPLLDLLHYDGPDPEERPNQAGGNPGDIPCVNCDTSIREDARARRLVIDDGMDNVEGEVWLCGGENGCWREQEGFWNSDAKYAAFRKSLKQEIADLRRDRERLERLIKILEEYASERSGYYSTWPPCPSCGAEVQWESFGVLRRPSPKPREQDFGWLIGCPECDYDEWRMSPDVGGK